MLSRTVSSEGGLEGSWIGWVGNSELAKANHKNTVNTFLNRHFVTFVFNGSES